MKSISTRKEAEAGGRMGVDNIFEKTESFRKEEDDENRQEKPKEPQPELPPAPESVMRKKLEKMKATLQEVQQQVDEGRTDTAHFRNSVLAVVNGYYVKSKYLQESDKLELRRQQAEAVVKFMPTLSHLAFKAFDAERQSRFVDPEAPEKTKPSLNIVAYTVTLAQNYSDISDDFALELSKIPDLLRLCSGMQREFAQAYLDGSLHKDVGRRLRQTLSVVYNILFKKNSESFYALSEFDFVSSARPYLQASDEHFKFSAYLVMVFGSTEEEAKKMLLQEEGMVRFLLRNLKSATEDKNKERRSKGYHAIELAKCTRQFASNDANKPLLLRCGILDVMGQMLQSEHEDSVEQAQDILFSLSFNAECAAAIKEQCGPELQTVGKKQRWTDSQVLKGIRVNLKDDSLADSAGATDVTPPAAPPPPPPGASPLSPAAPPPPAPQMQQYSTLPQQQQQQLHVMISYHQRSSADRVRWIKHELAKRSFPVWVDYEQMKESTLDCMAKAVEGAFAVLMCVSKGYKESDFCRMEADYAVRQKKLVVPLLMEEKYKPDGWLGFIMGSQRYYDFSGRKNKEQMLAELVALLQQKWPGSEESVAPTRVVPTRSARPVDEFAAWTEQQVQQWLADSQLAGSQLPAQQLNGEHLLFLRQLLHSSPEAFYRIVDSGLQLRHFKDVFHFVKALELLK